MLRSVYKTLSAGENSLYWKVGSSEQLILVGVNGEITDSLGNSRFDRACNIWVQNMNEANALSLAVGNTRNGQVAGYGCMPLIPGMELKANFYHCASGDIGKLNIYIMNAEEANALGLSLSPNWQPRVDALPVFGYGKPVVGQVDGGDAVTTVNLRPADGYIWDVIWALGYHNDATQRICSWNIYDGTTTLKAMDTAALNTAARVDIHYRNATYNALDTHVPLRLTYDVYAQWKIAALDAGDHGFIDYFVLEYCE